MDENIKEKYPFLSEMKVVFRKDTIIPGYNKESILLIFDSMIELNYAEYFRLNLPEEASQYIKAVKGKTINSGTLKKYSDLCLHSKRRLESVEQTIEKLLNLVRGYQDIVDVEDTKSLYCLSAAEMSSRLDKLYKLKNLLSFYVSLFKSAMLLSDLQVFNKIDGFMLQG